jgi:hypothetical protein
MPPNIALAGPPPPLVLPRVLSDTQVAAPQTEGNVTITLELLVDESGTVSEVSIVDGPEPHASIARDAARRWVFTPARRGGTAVSARIRFIVVFEPAQHSDEFDQAASSPSGEVDRKPAKGEDVPGAPGTELSDADDVPVAEISVQGERALGARRMSRATARQLPGAFGNPLRAIETMPGVTPTISGMPYFYIRGAPPGNVGYFLEGIRLPALFHVLAGPSVVHPAFLDEVEFHPGPYPARYGRFAGAVAAASVRPADFRLHGEANVRAFDSSAFVELPIASNTSATLGGRYS